MASKSKVSASDRELARRTYESYNKQYRAEINAAMPYGTMLEQARKKREEAQKLEENRTTAAQAMFTDKTWADWRKDRERITALKNEAEAAEQAASAYSAMMRQKGADRLSLGQLENYLNAPNAKNNPDIGYYRKAYDKKKSKEITKNLPKNVINLLDQYNTEDTNATADAYSSIAAAMTGQKSALFTSGAKKAQIGQELERLGYSNYKELAAYRKLITDSETTEKTEKEWEKFAKEHPTAAAASARLLSPTATVAGAVGLLKNSVSNSPLQSPNTKGADFFLSRAKNTIDETVSDSFEDGRLSKKTKAFLYQTGMSGIDSMLASTLGHGGGALLGAGAMVDKYIDASERGASQKQALVSSALSGVAESLFESLSIGQLRALKEIAPKSFRDVVLNIGKSTLTNFTEEATTEIANILSDYLINGGISDFQRQVQDELRAGYSNNEAKKRAISAMGKSVFEAGLGGALMGAAFGGVGSVGGKLNYESQLRERGRSLSEYGGEEKLLASAYQFGTDGDEKLAKYANAVEQSRNELLRKNDEYESRQAEETVRDNAKQEENGKAEKRPEYTRKELKQIGRLEEALAEHTEETAKGSAKMAVEQRLNELGESKENIEKVAAAAVKAISGEELSAKDKKAINNSKFGQRVLNEISDAMTENGAYSSSWAADMKEEINGIYDVISSPDVEAYRNRTFEGGSAAAETASSPQQKAEPAQRYISRTDMSDETLRVMDELREDGQDREAYERSFEAYYSMGKSGYTKEEALGSRTAAATSDFSDFQKEKAFELGQTAKEVQSQVQLKQISKIGENDTLVLDADGNEVSLSEVNADRGVKRLFYKAAKLGDVEAANAFLGGYETGMEVIPYEESFRSFNAAGRQNKNISFEQFIDKHSDFKELYQYIKPETAFAAYTTGAQYAALSGASHPKTLKRSERKSGSFINNTTAAETDAVFEAVAKKLGVDIVKEQSLWSEDGREANAQFLPSQMKIFISSEAQSEFTDTIHELGHLAESYNGEKMASVRGALFSWYTAKNGYASLEDAIGKFQESYGTSRENAVEEMTNEALAGLFSTDEGVSDFLSWLKEDSGYSKAEKKSVLQKIIDFFDRIIEAIRQTIKDGDLSETAREFSQMQKDKAAEIRKMFLDALDGIDGKKKKNAGEETKNSRKKNHVSQDGHFLSYRETGGSDAHEQAVRWAARERVKDGDQKLAYCKEAWYIIEKDSNDYAGYQVIEKIRKGEFNDERGRVEERNRENRRRTVSGEFVKYDFGNQQSNTTSDGGYGSNVDGSENKTKSRRVLSVDRTTSQRGKTRIGSGQNTFGGDENRTRTGAERLNDSEEKKNSLRHSLGITNEGNADSSLLSQNEEYRKLISELQTQLGKRHFVDAKKVRTLARVIKDDYNSTITTDELTDMLSGFYSSIANNEGLSWDVVKIKTREIAEAVISKSKNNSEISDRSKDILSNIRSVAIKLSDEQKAEVANYYGSYNDFRRSAFGTLKIRNDGISLDQRFSELAEAYPDIFDKETADVDQPAILFELAKALRNGYFDGDNGFDRDSAVDYLSADIYEKYFEIPDSKSLEDDYQTKLNHEKVKLREKLQKAKEKFKEENETALRAAREEYAANLSDIRNEYDERFLRNKARYEQRVQKIADTNIRAQKRKSIIRKVKRFSTMLLKTSNKSGYVGEKDGKKLVIYNNIPEELRRPVAALCECFLDDNSVFDYEKLDELRSSYSAIRADIPAEESYLSGIYDAEIEAELEKLKKTISGKRLSQLSQAQLITIQNILDHFDAMIKNETEIFINGRTRRVKDIGTETLNQLKAEGKKKLRQLGALQGASDTTKKFSVNNLKPVYFFERVGGKFKTLYWDLHKGQDKYVQNVEAAEGFFAKTTKQFGADKWLKKNDKVTFTTVRGEKLGLTLEQRLLIYATAKREQLSGRNSLHLMSGGVVFENQIKRSGDKTKPWKFRDEDAQAHPLALEDITKIVQSLTDSQKKFADSLVGYLSNDMAQLGNEVSMKLYGYRKFTEKYYIPFNSAESFGYQRFGEQGESLLRSLSFTKQTVRGAATPLVLSDFTEVFAKHVERMSAYNALVIPLENFGKVWNFKTATSDSEIGASVASQFETAFGKEYKDYFVQFIKDVNGNVMSDSREAVYNSLLRKFKKSAVFASASVAIQQPSAVCRAFAEVSPKYFIASTFDSRKSYDECMKYAPVALLKEIGGFDTASGRNMVDWILEAKSKPEGKEKFKAFFTDGDYRDNVLSAAPGLADRITWAHIWNAVKRETKAKTGLSGEKLLQKAGERFTEVIEKTQVYDSVLTRSGNMRSKSGVMQTVTAFMAEPTTTINMLADAVLTAREDPKKLFRVLSSVISATLFNSVLKSIITATRDDDDEKTNLEKYIAQVVGNFLNDMNPATLVPFVRDIYSLMTGYDISRSDMDMASNLIDAIKKCTSGDKVSLDKKITSIAGALGDFFGIPAKNIIRDIYSLNTAVRDIRAKSKTTEKGIKFAIQAEIFPSLKNLNLLDEATRQEKLYEAWLDKDSETYRRIAQSYKSGTAIKNALTDEIKKDYLDGTITAEKAEELLSPLVDEKNKEYYKIREWDDGEEAEEEEEDKNEGFYSLETAKVKKKEKEKKEKVSNVLLTLQGKDNEIEDEEETDEPYAKFTYLENAVKQSDAAAFKKEAADLKKHGISQETIETRTKTYLKTDKEVVAAGKRYAKGDVDALSESERIARKYGIEERTVQAAIRSVAGVTTYSDSLTEGTDYIYADMHTAIAAGDNEESARIANEIIEAKIAKKIAEGVSRSEAERNVYYGVRSSITSNWKQAYLSASSTKRAKIRESLYATGAYSSLSALDKTLASWRDGED